VVHSSLLVQLSSHSHKGCNEKEAKVASCNPHLLNYSLNAIRHIKGSNQATHLYSLAYQIVHHKKSNLRLALSQLHDGLALVQDALLHTVALGETHGRGIGVSNDEDVVQTGGEGLAIGVTEGDNVERSGVLLHEGNGTHAASVATTGDHGKLAKLELNEINHLAGGDVDLDNVVHLHEGVGVSKGAAIVCDNKGDLLLGDLLALDLAELVLLLLIGDAVKHVCLLGVVDKTELVAGLGDLDDIHETSGEVGVGADLAIHLDVLGLADHVGLLAGQSVLQSVSEHDDQGQRLSELVGALGRAGSLRFTHGKGKNTK